MDRFDIIEYISGMTSYVFDKAMIRRIAVDRGVIGVTAYSSLTVKDRDLIKADLLYEAYLSPTIMASVSQGHGGYNSNIGSQQTDDKQRERLYNIFMSIYRRYDDPKLEEACNDGGTLEWI